MARRYDVAVIGSGPGGDVAALRAAQHGASVACIERDAIGGVCLNEGCIPTKALLRSAEVYALVREAGTFGVLAGTPTIDWPAMQAQGRVVQQMVGGVTAPAARGEVIHGKRRSAADDHRRGAGDGRDTLLTSSWPPARAPAVPSRSITCSPSRAAGARRAPRSLHPRGRLIGCGIRQPLPGAGRQVTVIRCCPLLPLLDGAIGEGLVAGQRGVTVCTGTRSPAHLEAGGARHPGDPAGSAEAQWVLSALGPNVEGLGLEALGIQPTRQGIQTDHRMRTAVPGLYAIGDVAAEGAMLAHVASHQGIVAAEDALGGRAPGAVGMDYRAVPSCVFTLPEAASVGLTEEEARAAGYAVQVGVFAFPNNCKAVALGRRKFLQGRRRGGAWRRARRAHRETRQRPGARGDGHRPGGDARRAGAHHHAPHPGQAIAGRPRRPRQSHVPRPR